MRDEPVLTEVADGLWVRQSEWVWTNSIVLREGDGLILIGRGRARQRPRRASCSPATCSPIS
jgi:hypothetical protein